MKFLRKIKKGRGIVLVIAGLFVTSGALQLSVGLNQALATENDALPDAAEAAPASPEPALTQPPDVLVQILNQRERKVTELEQKMAIQKKALEMAEFEVRRRLEALTEAESRLRATLALADGAAEADLAQLTTVYENMKPKDAAALFEKMEPTFAAGFLSRMQPNTSAQILASLTPDKAYSISVIFAARNSEVPKE